MGRGRAGRLLPAIYFIGFTLLLSVPYVSTLPRGVWLGFIAAPLAVVACRWVWCNPQTFYRYKPVQGMALLCFVLYSLGAGMGVLASFDW